jgi:hypothetical protein
MMSLYKAGRDKGYAYRRYSKGRQGWPGPEDKRHGEDREHDSKYKQTRIETMRLAIGDAIIAGLKKGIPAAHSSIVSAIGPKADQRR